MTKSDTASNVGYDAAHNSVAQFDRSLRTRLTVSGRAPGQMLGGVVSGQIPEGAQTGDGPADGIARGTRHYSTVLTPKGRMLSDLYLIRLPGEDERFLLDVPSAGREALLDHFKRVLPPRLARVDDVTETVAHTTVVGPGAAEAIASVVTATGMAAVDKQTVADLETDEVWFPMPADSLFCVARSADTNSACYDLFYAEEVASAVRAALSSSGAENGDPEAWHTLRVEAGTPEFGADMTEETIPIEAGIERRAIDGSKGCYTGQEVIVRILHRGHVNRHLRTLRLKSDSAADPSVGDELFAKGSDKSVGHVTSLAYSGQAEAVVGLGYVRREVEVGSSVRANSASGPEFVVLERGAVAGSVDTAHS